MKLALFVQKSIYFKRKIVQRKKKDVLKSITSHSAYSAAEVQTTHNNKCVNMDTITAFTVLQFEIAFDFKIYSIYSEFRLVGNSDEQN